MQHFNKKIPIQFSSSEVFRMWESSFKDSQKSEPGQSPMGEREGEGVWGIFPIFIYSQQCI